MKNIISQTANVIILFLMTSNTGCASSLKQLPRLENRTLEIDPETGDYIYHYEVCKRKIIICVDKDIVPIRYKNNKETWGLFKRKGFVLKVRKPKL